MIGLHAHAEKPAAAEVVRTMARELDLAGLPYLLDHATAPLAGKSSALDLSALAASSITTTGTSRRSSRRWVRSTLMSV